MTMSTAVIVAKISIAGTIGNVAMDYAWQSFAEPAGITVEISPGEYATDVSELTLHV